MKSIHITTGDLNGIGLEVSLKALRKIGPKKETCFVLWRAAGAKKEILNLIDKNPLKHVPISEKAFLALSEKAQKKENTLWDIAAPPTPALWVKKASQLCLKDNTHSALVTGPLSKTQMQKEGFKERGHTDLLKKLDRKKYLFMTFIGDVFNITLLTGHLPLKKVCWSREHLHKCIALCLKWREKNFFPLKPFKKLGVLGLNPHAGEEGLIGKEDILLKKQLLKWQKKVEGPLVPDTAFLQKNRKKYFMYIGLYHDQGLIPFKILHERKSFQISLGLSFLRSSVSHGTAKDLFGKNKADEESMKRAMLYAVKTLGHVK